MNENFRLKDIRERLSFLNDRILRDLPGGDRDNVEIRRSSFGIEGGGAMYFLSFTVMPEGKRRADNPVITEFREEVRA